MVIQTNYDSLKLEEGENFVSLRGLSQRLTVREGNSKVVISTNYGSLKLEEGETFVSFISLSQRLTVRH